MSGHPMRGLTPDEMWELQRRNAEWMQPCTPAQALKHAHGLTNAAHLEPVIPTPAPLGTPCASDRALDAIERNALMIIEVTALKLAHTKDGSSAAKTLKGYLRAWKEALDLVRNERRGAAL